MSNPETIMISVSASEIKALIGYHEYTVCEADAIGYPFDKHVERIKDLKAILSIVEQGI